jgi:hypothetical protein
VRNRLPRSKLALSTAITIGKRMSLRLGSSSRNSALNPRGVQAPAWTSPMLIHDP